MEDLNKNQIVLLTLLVSFVTSIATGIMTTSLLQVAPVEITRNMNNIVEKTIEKVVPSNPTSSAPQSKEVTTIIVKEEDSIVDSVAKNAKSIVRIKEKDLIFGTSNFYGIGLVVDKNGYIAADRKMIITDDRYVATMSDGTEFTLNPVGVDKKTNFILFKAIIPDSTASSTTKYIFTPATLSSVEPKLGQTIVSIGGDSSNAVSVGRVSSLDTRDSTIGTTTTKYLSSIETDVSSKDIVNGTPLINLTGDVIGIKLSDDPIKSFTPIAVLKNELTNLMETTKTP